MAMKKIHISGEIGWNVYPSDVRRQLNEAKGGDIDIHIASPGGYVYEGIEIFNLIRDYKRDNPAAQVMITLKGLAASMASYLACNPAADMVVAEDNAVFMIHNTWSYAAGDGNELMKTAEMLKGLDKMLNKAYITRTGKTAAEIVAMMDAETWFFGSEIKEAGFVDEIIDAEDTEGEKDKSAAIATGKARMQSLLSKMQADERSKTDLQRAAASVGASQDGSFFSPLSHNSEDANRQQQHNPAAGGNNNQQEEDIMNLDELKAKHPALYADVIKAGRQEAETEAQAKAEKDRIPAIIALKKEFKDSPLSQGINEIIDESIEKDLSVKDTLEAIAKWTASGTAVASLESAGNIGTGANVSGSGEAAGPAGYQSKVE